MGQERLSSRMATAVCSRLRTRIRSKALGAAGDWAISLRPSADIRSSGEPDRFRACTRLDGDQTAHLARAPMPKN
jgi:hypothetical protein